LQVGTAYYIAPEVLNQAEGGTFGSFGATSGYTQACDLWSLGVIAYMLVRATHRRRRRRRCECLCGAVRATAHRFDRVHCSVCNARPLQLSGTPPFKGRRDREVLAAVRKGEDPVLARLRLFRQRNASQHLPGAGPLCRLPQTLFRAIPSTNTRV
jgi:serine/threonine protein kinase